MELSEVLGCDADIVIAYSDVLIALFQLQGPLYAHQQELKTHAGGTDFILAVVQFEVREICFAFGWGNEE